MGRLTLLYWQWGRKGGVVGAMFSSGCSSCLWGVECFNEEGGSRASEELSPSPHRAHRPTPIPKAWMVLTFAVGEWRSLVVAWQQDVVIRQDGHQVAPVSGAEAKLSRGLKNRGA